MKYTIQLWAESGNWAAPSGTDLKHASSKREAADLLRDWADTVGRYDDPQCASALVWIGDYDDTTDLYPDWQLTMGPRGGVAWQPA